LHDSNKCLILAFQENAVPTPRKLAVPTATLVVLAVAAAAYVKYVHAAPLVLTGIVTTHDVVVSSQIAGQLDQLLVDDGAAVAKDQLIAVIAPDELRADTAYYSHAAEGLSAQVGEAAAAVRFQVRQTADQIRQAEATLASIESQQAAARADLENARLTLARMAALSKDGIATSQQLDDARTGADGASARLEALKQQADAQRAAIALARSNQEQVAVRQGQLRATEHQRDAASDQRVKADVRLAYTRIHAPVAGVVDTRVVRPGEVVTAGQALVTIVNPDDLWVRLDVEETYIDRVRLGDRLTVRLPSGVERQGTVCYRGVDAAFATQRDVSRTKRDIKTFEVRLRMDNADRRLAVGMTAQVLFPVAP
jgi:HlyD family secretion protein